MLSVRWNGPVRGLLNHVSGNHDESPPLLAGESLAVSRQVSDHTSNGVEYDVFFLGPTKQLLNFLVRQIYATSLHAVARRLSRRKSRVSGSSPLHLRWIHERETNTIHRSEIMCTLTQCAKQEFQVRGDHSVAFLLISRVLTFSCDDTYPSKFGKHDRCRRV